MRRFSAIGAFTLAGCMGMVSELPAGGDDAATPDAGTPDAGDALKDAGASDAGTSDGGAPDAGGSGDAGVPDAGIPDAGPPYVDAGSRPVYLVTGQDQRRITSFDAHVWQNDTYVPANGLDDAFGSIAFGNGCIIMTGDPGIVRSTDGLSFDTQMGPTNTAFHGSVVRFNGSVFVIVGKGDSWRSADGMTWEHATNTGYSAHWQGLAWGNGHWVAAGDGHTKVSEDGLAWHDFTVTADPDPIQDLAFGNGVFVAVGKKNDLGRVQTSTDGVTWTELPLITTKYMTGFWGLAFGNGKFLTNDCCNMFESVDGGEWVKRGGGANAKLAFGAGKFIAINWRTNAFVYDEDAGSLVWTFGGDMPNQYDDAGLAPFFVGVGAGAL